MNRQDGIHMDALAAALTHANSMHQKQLFAIH